MSSAPTPVSAPIAVNVNEDSALVARLGKLVDSPAPSASEREDGSLHSNATRQRFRLDKALKQLTEEEKEAKSATSSDLSRIMLLQMQHEREMREQDRREREEERRQREEDRWRLEEKYRQREEERALRREEERREERRAERELRELMMMALGIFVKNTDAQKKQVQ